ncbi:hypothetical protein QJS04_geneDACA012764 [Acorus gramineus]|uniref:DIS3-like exonuclease 2 n=1 Tax=Acorus gramineus TaxID=55184 RepID=A0AAV9A1W9_ACOGR|nr:hypothetical protein QJS04_geneDACA012764 [Acorus gramineus]
MKGAAEQVVFEKKKRFRSKRSKQNVAATSPALVNEMHVQADEFHGDGNTLSYSAQSLNFSSSSEASRADIHVLNEQEMVVRASDISFRSLPAMQVINSQDNVEFQNNSIIPDVGAKYFNSCPEPFTYGNGNHSFKNNLNDIDSVKKKYFFPHLTEEDVLKALQKGDAFKASFRVNAYNRAEAYCTLDGVPVDALINGFSAQNRAIEGDTVAVMLDPVALWTRLKGSAGRFVYCNPVDPNMFPEVPAAASSDSLLKQIDSGCPNTGTGLLPSDERVSSSVKTCASDQDEAACAIRKICAMISSCPSKRPTGRVVAILEKSSRRDAVIGFLGVKQFLSQKEVYMVSRQIFGTANNFSSLSNDYIQLAPTDAKYPRLMIPVNSLPDCVKDRLNMGDETVEKELVAASIDDWSDENLLPHAHLSHILGRGGEIKPQIAAILLEKAICNADFSPESLACLPDVPWEVPIKEIESRKDFRDLCVFTIDPSTATDLDDALSVERINDKLFRVGVHIADVSYFVSPNSPLDIEAQKRSTSVYILQHRLPMLPSRLSEDLGSLNPGVERLALSIIWDIDFSGNVIDHWIGHSVIRSCCKLSYEHAQEIIDGSCDVENPLFSGNSKPVLDNRCEWKDVIKSVTDLHELSKVLKENRFQNGALRLESSKLVFSFDESGIPYDSNLHERKDAHFLVEEFMLLANRTAAQVISRAFPDSALLRRHPEPNPRKLKEFEAFWSKHGFDLDTSSAGQLHFSLWKIREKLKDDPVLFDVLINYASKPMQLASYFSTGDLKDKENEWAHYALAIPLYTHFTSTLRRYPDIVVHRTLIAVLQAEEMYHQQKVVCHRGSKGNGAIAYERCSARYFTGLHFDKHAAESKEGRDALSAAALKHQIPRNEVLAKIAAYCNERKLASKHAEEAGEKLYLWSLLRKKEIIISEARVLGVGPKFMSIYIHKLSMERRIYYEEVEGLTVEWLEVTSTLVLDISRNRRFHKRGSLMKCRALEEAALVSNPCDLVLEQPVLEDGSASEVEAVSAVVRDAVPDTISFASENAKMDPSFLPLTLRPLSVIPVVLHAVGGDDGPLDIGARLYISTYFTQPKVQ